MIALNGFLQVKLLYQSPADVSQNSQLMIPGTPRTCGRVLIYLRPGIHGTNTKRNKHASFWEEVHDRELFYRLPTAVFARDQIALGYVGVSGSSV